MASQWIMLSPEREVPFEEDPAKPPDHVQDIMDPTESDDEGHQKNGIFEFLPPRSRDQNEESEDVEDHDNRSDGMGKGGEPGEEG